MTTIKYVSIIESMVLRMLRKKIKNSGLSRYQIAKDTGIDQAALHRIMCGKGCTDKTIDKLMKYFGLEIIEKGNEYEII